MNKIKHSKQRKDNYISLRRVGYNSHEANRYKDMSMSKIKHLIKARESFKIKEKNIAGGKNL